MHSLETLIDALRVLPGVGQKSAQRMAYHLLQHDRPGAEKLAMALQHAAREVGHCESCHTLSESSICATCQDSKRDKHKICVVQTPADQAAIERTQGYRGLYFVLLGALSPLDGIGPKEIGLEKLFSRIAAELDGYPQYPVTENTTAQTDGEASNRTASPLEVIVATNFTAEGEMTAHVISQQLAKMGVKSTRIARGIPAGSDLEYVDLSTIAYAFAGRR